MANYVDLDVEKGKGFRNWLETLLITTNQQARSYAVKEQFDLYLIREHQGELLDRILKHFDEVFPQYE